MSIPDFNKEWVKKYAKLPVGIAVLVGALFFVIPHLWAEIKAGNNNNLAYVKEDLKICKEEKKKLELEKFTDHVKHYTELQMRDRQIDSFRYNQINMNVQLDNILKSLDK